MNFNSHLRLILAFSVILLCACGESATYEGKQDFEEKYWLKNEPVVFEFAVVETEATYDFRYFIRNSLEYPYQNIYLQYYLEDSSGNVIARQLNNVELFDSKTGKPLGSGAGDIYNLEKTFLRDYRFPHEGGYTLRIDQYMRQDTLRHVHTVGLILTKSVTAE